MRGEAGLREALAGFNQEWVDEALKRAGEVPDTGDDAYLHAVSAAVAGAMQARLAAFSAEVAARIAKTDAAIKAQHAADAAEAVCDRIPDRGIKH